MIEVIQGHDWRWRFWRLALLNILANLMVPLASLVDVAFLGHLADLRYLDGVALATVIFDTLYRSCTSLRMSTTGTTAQASGRQDEAAMALTLLRNGLLALMIGLGILTLQWPIEQVGFGLLHATPDIEISGRAYYDAMVFGAPANTLNFVLLGWLLGCEQGGKVLALSAVGNGTNIFLDYWFIVRQGWGSAGAGWATVGSQYLTLLLALGFVLSRLPKTTWLEIVPRLLEPQGVVTTLALNGNIFVRTMALGLALTLFTTISATLGPVPLATNTLLLRVVLLAAYFIDGMAYAVESLVGVFQGSGRSEQFPPLLQLAAGGSLGIGVGLAMGFILFPTTLFGFLTDHSSVLETIRSYVPWLLPLLGFGAIAYTLDGYFLGLTAGGILRNATLIATLGFFCPIAFLAWQWHSLHGLWLGLVVWMAARAIALGSQVPSTIRG